MLGMLGDKKKMASLIISASGEDGDKTYGDGKSERQEDMMNPVEMMAKELINAIHAKDAKRTAEIFCYILDVKQKDTKIEINT